MRALRQSGLGQIFFGGIVVSIILAFVLQSRTGGTASIETECAVNVGKRCVDPKEFFAAYGLVSSIGLNEKAVRQLRLQEKVARGLAEREVLLEEAKKLGIGASEEAVDADLVEGRTRVSLPAEGENQLARSLALCVDGPAGCEPSTIGLRALPVKKDGVFDFERYKKLVRVATSRSPNHFKEGQILEHTAERVREAIRSQARISEEEAFLTLARARSEAQIRTVRIEASWFEQHFTSPEATDLEKFAKEHEAELAQATAALKPRWKDGCPVVSEILLTARDGETDEALVQRAEALKATLSSDAAFERAARRESQAPSRVLGGRVGCLVADEYGTGGPELLAEAEKLEKPGAMSAPVKTLRGATLLRLVAKVTPETAEALVRNFETYRLTSAALASASARAFADALLARARSGESLEAATDAAVAEAVKKSLAENHPAASADDRPKSGVSGSFNRDGNPLPGVVGNESVAELAFTLEKPDQLAERPLPLEGGGFALVQLKERDLYTREKFEGDKAKVLPQLRAQKAEELLAKYVARLLEKAGGVTFNPRFVPPKDAEDKKTSEKKSAG